MKLTKFQKKALTDLSFLGYFALTTATSFVLGYVVCLVFNNLKIPFL